MTDRRMLLTDEALEAMLGRRASRTTAPDLHAVLARQIVAQPRPRYRAPMLVMRRPIPLRAVLLAAALGALLLLLGVLAIGQQHKPILRANGLLTFARGGDIYVENPDGTGERRVIDDPVLSFTGPEWSPDGTRIAFGGIAGEQTGGNEIYVADASTWTARKVGAGSSAAWMPDGSGLVFVGPDGASIWRVGPDGGPAVRLVTTETPIVLSWLPAVSPSPDSLSVAFVTDGGPVTVASIATGQTSVLAAPSTASGESFAGVLWSPGGHALAYSRTLCSPTPCHLSTVITDATGTTLAEIGDDTTETSPYAWSPDGTRLALLSTVGRDTPAGGRSSITVVRTDGTVVRQQPIDASTGLYSLGWSPDGTDLLYVLGEPDGSTQGWIAPADGSAPSRVALQSDGASWQSMASAPPGDGRTPAPAVGPAQASAAPAPSVPLADALTTVGSFEVTGRFVFGSPCGYSVTLVAQHPDQPAESPGSCWVADWSRDGRLVATDGVTVSVTDVSGIQRTNVYVAPEGLSVSASWSGDGSWIAIELWGSKGSCIHRSLLIRPDGSAGRELPGSPRWSPDGRHMLVAAWTGCGQGGAIQLGDGDGSDLRPLPLDASLLYSIAWSPDSSRLAYVRDGDAWVLGLDGGPPVNVTQYALGGADAVAWSPRGTLLAVERDMAIDVVAADGGGRPRTVAVAQPDWGSPLLGEAAWSPDGLRLAFGLRVGNARGFAIARADGGGIVRFLEPLLQLGRPTWSPDGARLAFTRTSVNDQGTATQTDLVVASADGLDRVIVPLTQPDASDPRWLP